MAIEFTDRETQIIKLVADGKSNAEIAEMLGIACKTAENYLSNIFDKLHVRNRTEVAVYWTKLQAN